MCCLAMGRDGAGRPDPGSTRSGASAAADRDRHRVGERDRERRDAVPLAVVLEDGRGAGRIGERASGRDRPMISPTTNPPAVHLTSAFRRHAAKAKEECACELIVATLVARVQDTSAEPEHDPPTLPWATRTGSEAAAEAGDAAAPSARRAPAPTTIRGRKIFICFPLRGMGNTPRQWSAEVADTLRSRIRRPGSIVAGPTDMRLPRR